MPSYDPGTALLVVDVQNDFADPSGSLHVAGGEEIVEPINGQIDRATQAGATVVYTRDWHPEHTPHFRQDGGIWPVHCVHGTWGAAFHPSLRVQGATVVKGTGTKDGYSAFSHRDPESGETTPTALEQLLRDGGVERLVICGLATDYCVVETVADARRLGYPVQVIEDAIRAVDLEPGDGDRAIQRIRDAGAELV